MFMGYLGRPESTQEVFTSDGFLRSGDVGYVSKVRRERWEGGRGDGGRKVGREGEGREEEGKRRDREM